jgi:hypothetical protein
VAKKPSRSQRKESRQRASRGATRSSPDGVRRPATPVPGGVRADDGERSSAPAPAPRGAGKRRRAERHSAAATRSFVPARDADAAAAPVVRTREARNERRNRALAGFLALLAIGGVAGWFLLNRDPAPNNNMVTVDVGGPKKDTIRPGDRVNVVDAPLVPPAPPDTRLKDPPQVTPPATPAPPPVSPPTSEAKPADAPKPSAPPKAATAKPAAPKPSEAPKAPTAAPASAPPPKAAETPY